MLTTLAPPGALLDLRRSWQRMVSRIGPNMFCVTERDVAVGVVFVAGRIGSAGVVDQDVEIAERVGQGVDGVGILNLALAVGERAEVRRR